MSRIRGIGCSHADIILTVGTGRQQSQVKTNAQGIIMETFQSFCNHLHKALYMIIVILKRHLSTELCLFPRPILEHMYVSYHVDFVYIVMTSSRHKRQIYFMSNMRPIESSGLFTDCFRILLTAAKSCEFVYVSVLFVTFSVTMHDQT